MTEHKISWYEANDGKIFTDEMECIDYELNLLYQKSGVTFFKDAVLMKELNDDSYNEMTDIFINRSKIKENTDLCAFIHDNYGWCDVEDALEGSGSHYHFSESPFESIFEVK